MTQTHEHTQSGPCRCYLLALEPNEQCPVHGHPWPPRCTVCGQMMPWQSTNLELGEVAP